MLCVAVAVAEWDGGVLSGGADHGCDSVESYSGGCEACGFFLVEPFFVGDEDFAVGFGGHCCVFFGAVGGSGGCGGMWLFCFVGAALGWVVSANGVAEWWR